MNLQERIVRLTNIARPHLSPYSDYGEIHAAERRMAEDGVQIITELLENLKQETEQRDFYRRKWIEASGPTSNNN